MCRSTYLLHDYMGSDGRTGHSEMRGVAVRGDQACVPLRACIYDDGAAGPREDGVPLFLL